MTAQEHQPSRHEPGSGSFRSEDPPPRLLALAQRLFWWQSPAAALRAPRRFLCQLMALGTWEDLQVALDHWTEADLLNALRHAPPGLFDPRSWHYWHRRLTDQPVPPLPVRRLP